MADVHLLAVLLCSTSVIHSCHPVAPSPHYEDPQVRAALETPTQKDCPSLCHVIL